MTISKKQMHDYGAGEYQRGYEAGVRAGRELARKEQNVMTREEYLRLINAVGQAMQVNASMLQGLGMVLDCGPRP